VITRAACGASGVALTTRNKWHRQQRQLERESPDFGPVVDAPSHFAAEQSTKRNRRKLHGRS
jgi:hypothetical protein